MSSTEKPIKVSDLQKAAIDEVQRCIVLANQFFQREFELDVVRFDLRGRSAGQFRIRRSRGSNHLPSHHSEIRLNAILLEQYGQRFIDETVGHEVAHFIVSEVYSQRVRPHGKEWQAVMREVLHQNPETTHNYAVEPARKLKRFSYHCGCDGKVHELGSIRHGRVQKMQAQYRCRDCRQCLSILNS